MWSGATFSPTATTCMALFPLHPLGATFGYTAVAAAVSIACTNLNGWFKEREVFVAAQAVSLIGTFIVISAAAVCNKEAGLLLPWMGGAYLTTYFGQSEYLATHATLSEGVGGVVSALQAPDVDGEPPVERALLTPTFNPAACAVFWALVINGVLVRAAIFITASAKTDKFSAAVIRLNEP